MISKEWRIGLFVTNTIIEKAKETLSKFSFIFQHLRSGTEKSIKLAPFKLRFSKMSKSRSGGSKGSRSNSTESEDSSQQRLINSPILSTSDTLGSNGNSFVFKNESTVPSSPPPSYQHVLEEVLYFLFKLYCIHLFLFILSIEKIKFL